MCKLYRELESRKIGEFKIVVAMSNSPSRKNNGFSYDSNEKHFDEIVDPGYGHSFHFPTSKQLLQMTNFEEMVELDIFYSNPKKYSLP